MGDDLLICADKIINICRVMRALPKDGAFRDYWRNLLGELQRLSVRLVVDQTIMEDGEREDEFEEGKVVRDEKGQFAPKGGAASRSTPYSLDEISEGGANHPCKGFTKANLDRHVKKHGAQYSRLSPEQYEDHARRFLTKKCGPDIRGYRMGDGCVCRFNNLTGEYAKGYPGGDIVTCFYPTKPGSNPTDIDIAYARDYYERRKRFESYD